MGIRCADHVTPLYPQKLTLTSPTGGGRSVGIVRSRTKATEFFLSEFIVKERPGIVRSRTKATEFFLSEFIVKERPTLC